MKLRIFFSLVASTMMYFAFSQLKIGYTNVEFVLSLMPKAEQVNSEIKTYEKQLQTQLEAKYQDYQEKVEDYQKNGASYSDVIRADKEKEITDLQESIQQFDTNAKQSLLKKQETLLQPLFSEIGEAIESVSKEAGYSHVFNLTAAGQNILLYAREEDDVTKLVLKKLGIDPPADN